MLNRCSILSAAQKILFDRIPDRCLYMREFPKDLLKMAKAECVWIITFSSNCNRKFLMNKNMCLNALKAVEIDKCWLNSLINIMRTSTSFLASVFKDDEPDCLFCWFVPIYNEVYSIRLLRKMNHHIIAALNFYQFVWMTAMYKWKTDKVQSVSSFKNNERAFESDSDWWQQIMNAEKTADFYQKQRKFNVYFTSKFSDIKRFSWLTQKQINRLIVDDLRFRKCELLLWMLRNWKKALAWDYSEMGCFCNDVMTSITIKTVKYEV